MDECSLLPALCLLFSIGSSLNADNDADTFQFIHTIRLSCPTQYGSRSLRLYNLPVGERGN